VAATMTSPLTEHAGEVLRILQLFHNDGLSGTTSREFTLHLTFSTFDGGDECP